jgi:DNA-directed RNA polymerase specialized sigma24 family protein
VHPEHSLPAEGAASFHTHWTIVIRAAQSQTQGEPTALAKLCQLYWYPLYVSARRRGYWPDDAQNLTQGFFLHLLQHRALRSDDRIKSKFRSFLLAFFQNHLSDVGRLRKRYTALLREEVGRTVSDPAEIDEKMHALFEALIASEGRFGPWDGVPTYLPELR